MLGTVFSPLRTSLRGEHDYNKHFIDEKRNSGLEESGDWPSYATGEWRSQDWSPGDEK